jgi:hypothetical protein
MILFQEPAVPMSPRLGEADLFFFRSSRFHFLNGKWFYMSRGGEEHGPFVTRDQAEADVETSITGKEKRRAILMA